MGGGSEGGKGDGASLGEAGRGPRLAPAPVTAPGNACEKSRRNRPWGLEGASHHNFWDKCLLECLILGTFKGEAPGGRRGAFSMGAKIKPEGFGRDE